MLNANCALLALAFAPATCIKFIEKTPCSIHCLLSLSRHLYRCLWQLLLHWQHHEQHPHQLDSIIRASSRPPLFRGTHLTIDTQDKPRVYTECGHKQRHSLFLFLLRRQQQQHPQQQEAPFFLSYSSRSLASCLALPFLLRASVS